MNRILSQSPRNEVDDLGISKTSEFARVFCARSLRVIVPNYMMVKSLET